MRQDYEQLIKQASGVDLGLSDKLRSSFAFAEVESLLKGTGRIAEIEMAQKQIQMPRVLPEVNIPTKQALEAALITPDLKHKYHLYEMPKLSKVYEDSLANTATKAIQNAFASTTQPSYMERNALGRVLVGVQENTGETVSEQLRQRLDAQIKSTNLFLNSQRTIVEEIYNLDSHKIRASLSTPFATAQLNDINGMLSSIVGDLTVIRSSSLPQDLFPQHTDVFLHGIKRIAAGYDIYLQDVVKRLSTLKEFSPIRQSISDLKLPTLITRQYISTVREAVVPCREEEDVVPVAKFMAEQHETWHSIDDLLGQVSPHLVKMWHGAWEVLQTDCSDRVRQAAHSGREVLNQALKICAPDDTFTPAELVQGKDGRPTRKMRFRKSIGTKSAAVWAEAVADAINETYGILCNISHDHSDQLGGSEQQVIGILETTQGLLRFTLSAILSNQEN